MIAVWIALALFWIFALFTKTMSEALWLGLLFLWILLAIHYFKSHRKWKREDKLRREERQDNRSSKKVPDETE